MSIPEVWNYWMWDSQGEYIYKFDHDISDHPDCDFLSDTDWGKSWEQQLFWTPEEAAALSFGRSPEKIPWNDAHWGVKAMEGDSEFAEHFCALRLEILSAQASGALPKPIPALMYIQWATASNLPFPPTLADELRKFFELVSYRDESRGGVAEKRATSAEKRQYNNLLRAVLGMAKDKYNHPKPGAAKRISNALLSKELKVGEDTILKWLNEAADLE